LADDHEDGDLARLRLNQDSSLHAPHLVDLEVLSTLRRQAARGALDARRVLFALQDLTDLPILRYPHLPFARRVWELRNSLSPYDAVYVALAEELECVLITTDQRLARSSVPKCTIELLSRR
jgi:predicted nucleic acid-binding protein